MERLYDVVSEPYYVFHIVAFFSYIPIRISASHILSPSSSYLLLRRIVREETWQAVIADALFFAKLYTCYHNNQPPNVLLESVLTEGNSSKNWLVEFRASCSSNCIRSSQCFPELSITYSNKNLSFGLVDLGLFPNAAEKYGILLKGMGQLPTYILFENGAEVNRFPELGFEAKPFSQPVTKALLCHHFELDRLLLEYVNGK